MTPEAIAAIFTGLTGLIAALAAWSANRNRRLSRDQGALRRRVRSLERQMLALAEHTFVLELEIARAGGRVPRRPPTLEQLDADNDDEGPAEDPDAGTEGPDGPPASGRHALRPDRRA